MIINIDFEYKYIIASFIIILFSIIILHNKILKNKILKNEKKNIFLILKKSNNGLNILLKKTQYNFDIETDKLEKLIELIIAKKYAKYYDKMEKMINNELKKLTDEKKISKEQFEKNKLLIEKKDIHLLNSVIMEIPYASVVDTNSDKFFINIIEINNSLSENKWDIDKFNNIFKKIDEKYTQQISKAKNNINLNNYYFSNLSLQQYKQYDYIETKIGFVCNTYDN